MFETRIKDISELPNLNDMKQEDHGMPENWGFCKGGEGLQSDQWAVYHVHEDFSEDRYPLPLCVSVLIDWNKKWEREEMQRSLRNLLGLDSY